MSRQVKNKKATNKEKQRKRSLIMRKRITSLLLSMVMISGLLFTAVPVHASEDGVEPDICEHKFSLAEASG